jgi:hypothetical protein
MDTTEIVNNDVGNNQQSFSSKIIACLTRVHTFLMWLADNYASGNTDDWRGMDEYPYPDLPPGYSRFLQLQAMQNLHQINRNDEKASGSTLTG